MAYCKNCGTMLPEGGRFCSVCGTAAESDNGVRRQEYAGTIRKCPNCGEVLGALAAICPACGFEINGAGVSDSLKAFTEELDKLDREIAGEPARKKISKLRKNRAVWIALCVLTLGIPCTLEKMTPRLKSYFGKGATPALTPSEKKKAALIENFTFPADRASLLEALLFVKSKIAFAASEKPTLKNVMWLRLWTTKAEELGEKAEMLLGKDKIAEGAATEIRKDTEKAEKNIKSRATGAIVLIALHILLTLGVYIAIIPTAIALFPEGRTDAPYDYPELHLATVLPSVGATSGEIAENTDTRLHLTLMGVSEKEYIQFVSDCKERFPIVLTESKYALEAAESDGHGHIIRLQYYDRIEELQIIVTEPD